MVFILRKFELHHQGKCEVIEASCYYSAKRIAKDINPLADIILPNKGYPMTIFKIVRRCLPQKYNKHQYLKDGMTYDFLGQMMEQLGICVPDKIKFPSELDVRIEYITFSLRGRIIETPLAISIMKLDSVPSPERYQKFEQLLNSVGLKVEWL